MVGPRCLVHGALSCVSLETYIKTNMLHFNYKIEYASKKFTLFCGGGEGVRAFSRKNRAATG